MARKHTIPERTYPAGTYGPFELRGIPANTDGVSILFTRVNWPEGRVAKILVEHSKDNGTTWRPRAQCVLSGGVIPESSHSEVPLTVSGLTAFWPGKNDGTGRRVVVPHTDVRVSAEVYQPFTTSITIEAV